MTTRERINTAKLSREHKRAIGYSKQPNTSAKMQRIDRIHKDELKRKAEEIFTPTLPPNTVHDKKIHQALPFTSYSILSLFGIDDKDILTSHCPIKVKITPAIAKSIFVANVSNRLISDPHVEFLAGEMLAGNWQLNGDTIRFAVDGSLLDGQHRLKACIKADVEFETFIVFNLPRSTQLSMDSGRKRSIGDQLSIGGEKYAPQIAAAIKWVYAISTKNYNYKLSTIETVHFLSKFPSIRESVALVHNSKPKGITNAMLAAVHFLATVKLGEKSKADAFVGVFATGVPTYHNDAAQMLRERIIETRLSNTKISSLSLFYTLLQSWNLFRKKKEIKAIRFSQKEIEMDGIKTNFLIEDLKKIG